MYTVAVRNLCDFTAKQGDLDLRFTPAPTALQGIEGHTEVTSRRAAHYQREVSLAGSFRHLQVRGRADGYDPHLNRLEEIKTHRGDIARLPDNQRQLHWAQAKVYASLMCQKLGLAEIEVALVYFDVGSQKETLLSEPFSATDLRTFFESLCSRFLIWADQETAHRAARDAALLALEFPHAAFRGGQRALAETVYKGNIAGRCLLAQAPTGIGKTMGTVFPVLKAMPGQRLDKVFYLTAKTPGRRLALDALQCLRDHAPALPLRVLELVARDKACEHPDKACHGESCPLARGFYDRLPAAREAAATMGASVGSLSKPALRELALAHSVCPYYLGQEMARWSDVVVGDYNHYLDLSAHLFAHTLNEDWRVSVLLDEAHNLIERARQMYSSALDHDTLAGLRANAAQPAPGLKKALDKLHRQWNLLVRDQTEAYKVYDSLPDKFILSLQKVSAEITELFAQEPTRVDGALQTFHFEAQVFLRLAELHGAHSLFDISLGLAEGGSARGRVNSTLCIRNVVPGPHLKDRWAGAHAATLFSATLTPKQYLMDMLGLPETTAWLDVPSAFSPEQLQVHVARHISTRYSDRNHSLDPLVTVIADQFHKAPGNYLAFFSSFDYLQMAAARLMAMHPSIPVWQQSRRMSEPERDAFLARFTPASEGIGFAVLGGAFGEGIDLPGARLIGAFIATLGLPQINPVNEAMKERVGYDYTYLFPGIQKVVQAAGRVIRTSDDQGVVVLLDDRFGRADVQRLLPLWWGRPQPTAP